MCNLYSITTNQATIIALFRVMNQYVGNLPPMPGVFPDYPAPVVRNAGTVREMVMMRWGMPPPPRAGGFPRIANARAKPIEANKNQSVDGAEGLFLRSVCVPKTLSELMT
jgi:putative SOS response-associated peptidase YedK